MERKQYVFLGVNKFPLFLLEFHHCKVTPFWLQANGSSEVHVDFRQSTSESCNSTHFMETAAVHLSKGILCSITEISPAELMFQGKLQIKHPNLPHNKSLI